MSTIEQNLTALAAQKVADQASVSAAFASVAKKGVTVAIGAKLADIHTHIDLIETPYLWVAPTDWIQLEDPSNNEILLLIADSIPIISFNVTVLGGYVVDWGDGIVENFASATKSTHTYTVGSGQACSIGYTTFKIRIYAQIPTNPITRFYVMNTNFATKLNSLLWAKIGTLGLTSLRYAFFSEVNNGECVSVFLQSIELPTVLGSCIDFYAMMANAIDLQYVKMPLEYSSSPISFGATFMGTVNLKTFNFRTTSINISTMLNCFSGSGMESIIFPNTVSGCSSFANALQNCIKLRKVVLPDIDTDCSCQYMVDGCISLESFTFTISWNNHIIVTDAIMRGCKNLFTVNFPIIKTASLWYAFSSAKIKTLNFPVITTLNGLDATFNGMSDLETINNFPAMNSISSLVLTFNNCYMLKNIDNLDQLGNTTSSMDLATTYAGCYSLNPVGGLKIRNKITGRFVLSGVNSTYLAALSSLLFTNPNAVSTWGGASPQIDIAYCSLDATALNALFTSIINTSASFSGKTIRITGNPGAGTCDTTIITNAGGTVNITT
jgi:hypothetical protein